MRSLAFMMLLAAAESAQERDFSKVEVKATRVAGNVFILKGAGGNIAATVGGDGIAIVDDQFAFVINTHWHGDHTGGNALFSDTASIFAHENVRKRLIAGAKTDQYDAPPAPPAALPVVTFEQGLSLWWNGEEIRVIHLPPGHTDGDSVVWFMKSNVVHLGDDFLNDLFPFVDLFSGGSATGMIAALDWILPQLPPDAKIIPGHGEVSTVADVREFRAALDEMVGVVRKGLAGGKSVRQMQKEKVLAPWQSWQRVRVSADGFIAAIAQDLARK